MMNTIKSRKSLLIKSTVGAAAIMLLLWLLFPSDRYHSLTMTTTSQNQSVATTTTTEEKVVAPDEEEPNALSEHCTTAHPGRPLVQYALMIDAGSSGSRIHVYRFNYCREEPELEDEVFYPIEPGLSSYKDDPEAAAASLDELMQIALDNVPAELQHCTPLAVKATAGLRLLGEDESANILNAVRTRLETNYPFPLAGVEIMDGKDEGVYAWITVNYLLGKLKKGQKGNSAAIFDLGGASTQIVFEPKFGETGEAMQEGEHKYVLNYGHEEYVLYQHSYLGYGLKEARKQIKMAAVDAWKEEALRGSGHVFHPCLPDNYTETITWEHNKKTVSTTLIGTGAGHTECRGLVEHVFKKDKECNLIPCAFDGVYQPPIAETFTERDLYVFSFFYDLTQPLGMPSEFSVQELGDLARRVCGGETKPFQHVPNALETLSKTPDYCLDLTYIHGLLRIGYDIPSERLVRTAKKIRGAETGWCLGASIAMIDQVRLCQTQ